MLIRDNAQLNMKSLSTGDPENSGFRSTQLKSLASMLPLVGKVDKLEKVCKTSSPLLQEIRPESVLSVRQYEVRF